jgi:hypothetical protein
LQEFCVTVTRKAALPLDAPTAAQIIADLDTWRIHTPDDAMIVQSAAQLGCSVLWSEDLNRGQQYARVRVADPFENS